MTTQSSRDSVGRRALRRLAAWSSPPTSGMTRSRVTAALFVPAVAFAVLWLVALLLAQIHVLDVQRPWSSTAWLVMVTVSVAFVVGGFAARWPARALAHPRPNAL